MSGVVCRWTTEMDNGRPDASTRPRSMANSTSSEGVSKSEMNCRTPLPASFSPRAMPINSSALARKDGVGSPRTVRWFSERVVFA